MKLITLAVILFLGCANALEREQEFGAADSEISPVEETTVQVPVTSVRPGVTKVQDKNYDDSNDDDDDDSDDDETSQPTECSRTLCSGMCRRSGCGGAFCLPNNRCGCVCAQQISPRDFFRRIFGTGYTPRFHHNVPSFPRIPDFPAFPPIEDRLRDVSKLFESLGRDDGTSMVHYTMQHTCEETEDCSRVCANCTSTKCVKNFCQCLACGNNDALETRAAGKEEKTCQMAWECDQTCRGCSKVGCRYGACQCGKCSEPKPDDSSEVPSTESDGDVAETTPASESSTVSVDILSLRPSNQTRDDVTVNGKCVPKRCNHACWERQCSKWNCIDDRCDCDGCPDDMAVVVKNSNGKTGAPEDSDKYEIIF